MKTGLLLSAILSFTLFSGVSNAQNPTYSWAHLPSVETPVFRTDTFNIADYGAKGDGSILNTVNINNAISACNKKGGGVVLIPAGVWQTGPIVLKSNVNLYVSKSALLQFTDDKSQYHLVEGNFEGRRAVRNESPITGTDLENIAITGEGIIDGHGEVWRAMGKDRVTEKEWQDIIKTGVLSDDGKTWYPSESYAKGVKALKGATPLPGKPLADYMPVKDFFRPNLLVLTNCKRVLLQNVTFQNSPAWCLHTLLCEQLTFDGVKVRNEENAQNGDGMDIESCAYVRVENCTLDCGDDGICIKSGKDEEGRKRGKASMYMVIRNNVVYKAHGGFVIGSEMSGGAHDIFVSDCTFIGTASGLRFKTVRGRGGIVENIFIRNIRMRNIVGDAVTFDMYYFTKAPNLAQGKGTIEMPPVGDGTPRFRKFYIENIVCDGAARGILLRGLPEMSIQDIHITGARITADAGMEIVEASNIKLKNISLVCEKDKKLIHIENSTNIDFDYLNAPKTPPVLFSIDGDRSRSINLAHSPAVKADMHNQFQYGAKKDDLTVD
ncbi:glycoside hydrolase family 28 protein [Mucilaginibacter sp. AW1-3]